MAWLGGRLCVLRSRLQLHFSLRCYFLSLSDSRTHFHLTQSRIQLHFSLTCYFLIFDSQTHFHLLSLWVANVAFYFSKRALCRTRTQPSRTRVAVYKQCRWSPFRTHYTAGKGRISMELMAKPTGRTQTTDIIWDTDLNIFLLL